MSLELECRGEKYKIWRFSRVPELAQGLAARSSQRGWAWPQQINSAKRSEELMEAKTVFLLYSCQWL